MARYRTKRRRNRFRPSALLGVAFVAAITLWWGYRRLTVQPGTVAALTLSARPAPDIASKGGTARDADGATNPHSNLLREDAASIAHDVGQPDEAKQQAASLWALGREALQRGEFVSARASFAEACELGLDEPELSLLRTEITRLGREMIFSARAYPGDPLVARYIIQPGDSLGKIATVNRVSAALLASINNIQDINRIRAGQTIKIINGPFHAIVDKSSYTLDLYLGKTFVQQYKVGLGLDGSTPIGEWRVATKLENPTYYPPRGGSIIAADDPANPLGERWLGLVGVSGEAVGQLRYGIHGTIDPDSIGQNVSLGCIRMHNHDVEALYTYLVESHSIVTVRN